MAEPAAADVPPVRARYGRVRTPTILQMEAAECGAAALAIVLAHHGRWVPLEQMRADCAVTRDGSNALQVMKAARLHGMNAQGMRMEPRHLREVRWPCIVFWDFCHFLVVEGVGRRGVFVNDPASGPRRMSFEEFDRGFTGVAIVLEPTATFRREGRPPSVFRSMAGRLRGSWHALGYVFLAAVALVVPGVVVPAFQRIFVDYLLKGCFRQYILYIVMAMVVTAVLSAGLAWAQGYFLARLETRLALSGASRFFWHLLRLPLAFYLQRDPGDLGSRVALNDHVAAVFAGRLVTACVGLLAITLYGAVMWHYDAGLTRIVLALAFLDLAALVAVSRTRTDTSRRFLQQTGRFTGSVFAGIQMIESVKASGREADLFARWSGYQAQGVRAQQELGASSQLLNAVPPLLLGLGNIVVLVVGGMQVLQGTMTVGSLSAFQMLMTCFLSPVSRLMEYGQDIQEAAGELARLDDVFKYPAQVDPMAAPPTAWEPDRTGLDGSIRVEGLAFGYSRGMPPLIKGFDLEVRPGSHVALVGPTGSGKSTIGRLVCGLLEPWEGRVCFDGVPRSGIPREVLGRSVAYVDQDIVLFPGTIRENLTLWNPEIPDEVLVRALRDAGLEQRVLRHGPGLDGRVEEDARNFSGGERRRLEIARALALEPRVVVLDEATSALDPVVEHRILSSLAARGLTVLSIAHRLSTVRDCELILVIEQGRVIQRGTHRTLMAEAGLYRDLVQAETVGGGRAGSDAGVGGTP